MQRWDANFEGADLSFRELERQSREFARALVGAGVGKGSRVALLMANRPEWVVASFAVGLVGGVLVPVNTFATPDGRYIAAGMVGARTLSLIDTSTDEIAWSLGPEAMIQGVRPMGFETNSDGSTRRNFVNLSSLEGFVVVDFDKRVLVRR